jgi:UDP-N-acetylmuramoylalanine--D-glutamate ligase
MKNVNNRHILVIGAARSGVAAAILLQRKGASVFLTDNGSIEEQFKKRLQQAGLPFEENEHTQKAVEFDFAVLSPGVPQSIPLVQEFLNNDKPVYSEIEAASWFNQGPIVAVTGSNGKTTVTHWLDHTWSIARRKHITAGNIGTAFSDKVLESTPDTDSLLEVSSFQLENISSFHPFISVLLNISPDHLKRYENSMKKYAAAKFRIMEKQDENDWIIYHRDDPIIHKKIQGVHRKKSPRILAFSSTREVQQGAYLKNNSVIIKMNGKEEELMPVHEIHLNGTHNVNNGLATALAARVSEINNDEIRESLRTFGGVNHRLEKVRTVEGITYINDSKGTNTNAVWYALKSFDVPVALILGGRDKGSDYTELIDQIREKVHTIVAIGEAKPIIKKHLAAVVPHFMEADTMEGAVRAAQKYTKRGEIILLSPACSSYDIYKNYTERGDDFKEIVNRL